MRFYYISIFSVFLLGLIYLVGTGLLVWFWSGLRQRMRRAWVVMVPLFALLYIGLIAEELWIAWNFGRLCAKDAGIFVYKTVEVEGFYDDVMGWGVRQLSDSGYKFMESKSAIDGMRSRVEVADDQARDMAIDWYDKNHAGKKTPPDYYITYEASDGRKIIVSPDRTRAWHLFRITSPAARYHFFRDAGSDTGHKLRKQESRVLDSKTDDLIAEYRVYIREAPWFYIGLDRPNMGCDSPDGGPHSKHKNSFLIYRDVLMPIRSRGESTQ